MVRTGRGFLRFEVRCRLHLVGYAYACFSLPVYLPPLLSFSSSIGTPYVVAVPSLCEPLYTVSLVCSVNIKRLADSFSGYPQFVVAPLSSPLF